MIVPPVFRARTLKLGGLLSQRIKAEAHGGHHRDWFAHKGGGRQASIRCLGSVRDPAGKGDITATCAPCMEGVRPRNGYAYSRVALPLLGSPKRSPSRGDQSKQVPSGNMMEIGFIHVCVAD